MMHRSYTLTSDVPDARFLEPVSIQVEGEQAMLAMLPHALLLRLMGPDADEPLDPVEA
jgi:hypothetical protein